jgi:hypothetical protein
MTDLEVEQYFQYHNANIKSIKIGYDEVRNQIKRLYRRTVKDSDQLIFNLPDDAIEKTKLREIETSLNRILSGIQVSWAEESIKRLLYERNLLSDAQREYLIDRSALDQKWLATLKIVFCIAYDLISPSDQFCEAVDIRHERSNLGDELVDQYFSLRKVITQHLTPNFSIRNKVQHGEWVYAFKSPSSKEFSQEVTDKIRYENIITTTSRYTLVNALYQMMVDLGRFRSDSFALDSITTPFEYFYQKYMRKINYEVNKIENCNLDAFINEIVQKELRGIQYRKNK